MDVNYNVIGAFILVMQNHHILEVWNLTGSRFLQEAIPNVNTSLKPCCQQAGLHLKADIKSLPGRQLNTRWRLHINAFSAIRIHFEFVIVFLRMALINMEGTDGIFSHHPHADTVCLEFIIGAPVPLCIDILPGFTPSKSMDT